MLRLNIELSWTEARESHLLRHGVESSEVDETLSGDVLIRRYGRRRYQVWGRTGVGRYLFVILERTKDREWFCVTARDMMSRERDYFAMGGK